MTAKDFSLHLRRSPGDNPGSDILLRIGDISHPFIDRFVGSPEPMVVELQATAPGLLLDPTRRIEESVEAWRLAKGQARVVLAKATKGQAAIDLSGVMGLDAERRPEGNLQGRARGIDQILNGVTRRMGLEIGGLLGRLAAGRACPSRSSSRMAACDSARSRSHSSGRFTEFRSALAQASGRVSGRNPALRFPVPAR